MPTGSKTVTYSKNIDSKKHKTYKISYKSENNQVHDICISLGTGLNLSSDVVTATRPRPTPRPALLRPRPRPANET